MQAHTFGHHLGAVLPDTSTIESALERAELEAAMLRRMMKLAMLRDRHVTPIWHPDIVPFVDHRHAAGHHDATIYADLSTIRSLVPAVIERVPRWWVAWYWGKPGRPSRAQVHAQLAEAHPGLDPATIWACQYQGGDAHPWDLSVVYGPEDFSR